MTTAMRLKRARRRIELLQTRIGRIIARASAVGLDPRITSSLDAALLTAAKVEPLIDDVILNGDLDVAADMLDALASLLTVPVSAVGLQLEARRRIGAAKKEGRTTWPS